MSDGWGDASGIEGNYEEEDDEAIPAKRVRWVKRWKPVHRPKRPNRLQRVKRTETSKTKTNIKDEWNGRTIYIPDDVLDEMEDTYLESQLKLRKAGRTSSRRTATSTRYSSSSV